jgi:penicillin V acylase-like amidase (Ntn superfamily)
VNLRQIPGPVPGARSAPPLYGLAARPETSARIAGAGFWRLCEGKHTEEFPADVRPIERWVSLEAYENQFGEQPDPGTDAARACRGGPQASVRESHAQPAAAQR